MILKAFLPRFFSRLAARTPPAPQHTAPSPVPVQPEPPKPPAKDKPAKQPHPKLSNPMANFIDTNYKTAYARDRQVSAKILKTHSKYQLFHIYQHLIRHPNFNTSHLVLIFGRLIEVEQYHCRNNNRDRVKLVDQTPFYRILDQMATNIDRMLQESIVYLLKRITYGQFFHLDYTPILMAICAHLMSEGVLPVMEKFWMHRTYFYLVRIYNDPHYRNVPGLDKLLWKLVKETQKHVTLRDMPTHMYYALARYHFMLPMTVQKRAAVLNKELLARKKWATNRDLFHWLRFNCKVTGTEEFRQLALMELINKKGYDVLNSRRLTTVCLLVARLEMPGAPMLKTVFLEHAVASLKKRLAEACAKSVEMKNLDRFLRVISELKVDTSDIHKHLYQIMKTGLCGQTEELQILNLLIERKHKLTLEEVQGIINRGRFESLNLEVALQSFVLVKETFPEADLEKIGRKCIKIFARRFQLFQKNREPILAKIEQVWGSSEHMFTFYLYYLRKVLRLLTEFGTLYTADRQGEARVVSKSPIPRMEDIDEIGVEKGNRVILTHLPIVDKYFPKFDRVENRELRDDVLREMRYKLVIDYLIDNDVKSLTETLPQLQMAECKTLAEDIRAKILEGVSKNGQK